MTLTPAVWPDLGSGRVASTWHRGRAAEAGEVALFGFPDHTGVILNGGRPGAAEGPFLFRKPMVPTNLTMPVNMSYLILLTLQVPSMQDYSHTPWGFPIKGTN